MASIWCKVGALWSMLSPVNPGTHLQPPLHVAPKGLALSAQRLQVGLRRVGGWGHSTGALTIAYLVVV